MSPLGPTFICHTDGASRGNPGPAAAGVVVLDGSGRERKTVSVFLGEATNNVAEYLALGEALKAVAEICREDGVAPSRASVILKTDSQLAAKQIAGEYKVKNAGLAPLLSDFREAAATFYRVQVSYVPRELDPRADRLANQTLDRELKGAGKVAPPRAGSAPERTGPERAGPSRYSRLTHLECSRCGRHYEPRELLGPCPSCDGPLLARYDVRGLVWPPGAAPEVRRGGQADFARSLGEPGLSPENNSMWRYHELLPVTAPQYVVSLGEGLTPLVALPGLEREAGVGRLFVKDERLNPTGTFKCRGASAAVSRLVELGVDRCAIPTAGNAGSAFAAYTARAGMRFLTAMPEDTPEAIRSECEAYGAKIEMVKGLLTDAARYIRERSKTEGWFSASTFDEPYRVEGKKTIGLEILEEFGGTWPDAILCPVGGGVALVAIWKAAQELSAAGIGGRPPRLFAIQAAGCAPVVKAFVEGRDETEPFPNAQTVAAGLRVPAPKAGFLVLRALRETGGGAVAVPDEETLKAARRLRRSEGLNFCPEGAAAVAALAEIARRGWLEGCRNVVIVNTGTGLKYPLL